MDMVDKIVKFLKSQFECLQCGDTDNEIEETLSESPDCENKVEECDDFLDILPYLLIWRNF